MNIRKSLISDIQSIIAQAREKAVRSVNHERVLMYWQIGKVIFEEEQQGKDRAEYGEFLIKSISQELQPQFGSGFSVRQLRNVPSILSILSNCEHTAFAIQLVSL
ncbi:MAG TPA: DUF1016 N-terminal domain-containing protein [Saprospiraceae bacterium]|nr:DUF1016 N-terminal domain-containing protein [Saprospiraceae bacterium]HPQ21953.1 DUF1016 N-terminal domain-containing protein [Saprospiraceae bacterium]